MESGLLEREAAARLTLLGALSGEHSLLIGPPGTAKSVLARRLHLAFEAGHYFERLLTRFSVPEELFGPLSIKALENDSYRRLTERYLPTANIAFLDEVFKANSAILNTLLTLLNEGEFDNGDCRVKVPLISVVGASNELPEGDDLQALYDRFICRYNVHAVADDNFVALLELDEQNIEPAASDRLSHAEVDSIQTAARAIPLSADALSLIKALRPYLAEHNIVVSDRRWRKVVKLLKVAAHTNAQPEVSLWDCCLLQHCLWNTPAEQDIIQQWLSTQIGAGSGFKTERLEKLIATWESTLQADKNSQTQIDNEKGEHLYRGRDGKQTTDNSEQDWARRDGLALYLSPPDQDDRSNDNQGYTERELTEGFFDQHYQQCHIDGHWQHIDQYIADPGNRLIHHHKNPPCMEATVHPASFIRGRLEESHKLASDIEALRQNIEQGYDAIDRALGQHLWITACFIASAKQALSENLEKVSAFKKRLELVVAAYQHLADQQQSPPASRSSKTA
ncbi:MAG: AAA family ATPase [Gammaproteobacteria bacterium]|nr:AAA family ATPase [Gammaproteobacteria bacterium]MBQ0840783.1 AAA family ATPase [Gammaproteobacteria bacterium]